MMPYSLPGFSTSQSSRSVSAAVAVLALVLGGALAGLVLVNGRAPAVAAQIAPLSPPKPERPRSVDESFHLSNVETKLQTALEQVSRTQRLVGGLAPELGRNGLWAEQRKAESATAACESARQTVEQALTELQLALPHKE